jgi:hypothetical protein
VTFSYLLVSWFSPFWPLDSRNEAANFVTLQQYYACIAGISKFAATAQLGWHRHRLQMQYESMLIYPYCRLRTEVAIGAFEV